MGVQCVVSELPVADAYTVEPREPCIPSGNKCGADCNGDSHGTRPVKTGSVISALSCLAHREPPAKKAKTGGGAPVSKQLPIFHCGSSCGVAVTQISCDSAVPAREAEALAAHPLRFTTSDGMGPGHLTMCGLSELCGRGGGGKSSMASRAFLLFAGG